MLSHLNHLPEIISIIGSLATGLALAHQLGVPSVAFYGTGPETEFAAASLPPSYVPAFTSELSDEMAFSERAYNLALRAIYRHSCHMGLEWCPINS